MYSEEFGQRNGPKDHPAGLKLKFRKFVTVAAQPLAESMQKKICPSSSHTCTVQYLFVRVLVTLKWLSYEPHFISKFYV